MWTFLKIFVPLAIPFIAWLPTNFWTLCGDPWCLKFYPGWLDRMIYSIAAPRLHEDMGIAAAQMEFIEVYIASIIIMEIAAVLMLFVCKDVFDEEYQTPPPRPREIGS